MKTFILTLLLALIAAAAAGCFRDVGSYRDEDGSLVIMGEVLNTGDPLADAHVTGTLYDADGNVIATGAANVCRPLPTGGTSAFQMVLPPGTPDPARIEWNLSGDRLAPGSDTGLAKVNGELVNEAHGEQGETHAYGEITNESASTYNGGLACVAYLNDKGEIIRILRGSTPGVRLEPGETEPFVAVGDVPGDAVATRLYLDAFVPRNPPAPGAVGDAVMLPESSFNRRHGFERSTQTGRISGQFGEVHNDSDRELLVTVSGTARDGDGTLVATSAGGSPRCHVTAEPGSFTFGAYEFAVDGRAPDADVSVEALISDKAPAKAVNVKRTQLSSGIVRVTYDVKNPLTSMARAVNTCVGLYAADGDVIGMLESRAFEVAAGATASYSVDVPAYGKVDRVVVIADAQ